MWYTNMYSNIIVYQKYLVTSIKVGCATRSLYASLGPNAEGFPTNSQRGRGLNLQVTISKKGVTRLRKMGRMGKD